MTASKRTEKPGRVDVSRLKDAAAGRWPEILRALTDIPGESLDGAHHPCFRCGGVDRFSLVDADAGAILCRGCFDTKNGDGIAATMWATGWTFPETLQRIAEYLGLMADPPAGPAKGKPAASLVDQFSVAEDSLQPVFVTMFANAKPPITAESVIAAGGIAVRWPKKSHNADPCVAWPATDDRGNVCGWILRKTTGREFAASGTLGPRKTHTLRGSKDGWVIPGGLDRLPAATVIWKVEGVPDALALHPLLPPDHVAVSNICGSKSVPPYLEPFRGKVIFIVGDADRPGEEGAAKYAAKLSPIAAEVRVVRLPFEVTDNAGKDLRDYLLEGGTFAELQALADAAPASETAPGAIEKTTIEVENDEHRVLAEIVPLLPRIPGIYQRSGRLVRVECDSGSSGESPRIGDLPEAVLRNQITGVIDFKRWKGSEEDAVLVSVAPPGPVIKALHQSSHWPGVPRLAGIVSSPILRPDGTVLSQPGYDPTTELLLADTIQLPEIPKHPTQRDAILAAQRLLDVVSDFPFKDEAHKSAWLASLLTVLARHSFRGSVPLFLIDANTRGSGKSLLADIIFLIALGTCASRFSYPDTDEEFRKRVTALIMAGDLLVLLDNVSCRLGCDSLDALLTSEVWKDRILGQSSVVEMVVKLVIIATGNNTQLQGDTSRRAAHIRLESPDECPEERQGFAHSDLREHVRANRPQLLADALTILAAYFAAGKPSQGLKPWGSFEAWTAVVRNAVVWCGLADPATTREELIQSSDPQTAALAELIEGWPDLDPQNEGLTAAQILRLIERNPDRFETVRTALSELCPTPAGRLPGVRQVGNRLKSLRGRVVDGRKLDGFTNRNKVQTWFVEEIAPALHSQAVSSAGSAGSAGSVSNPYGKESVFSERTLPHCGGLDSDPADPADPAPLIPDLSEVATASSPGRTSPQSATAQNLEHSTSEVATILQSDRGPLRTTNGGNSPALARSDMGRYPWLGQSSTVPQAGG